MTQLRALGHADDRPVAATPPRLARGAGRKGIAKFRRFPAAGRGGRGVMLANNTMAHDGLSAGWLVRPVAESMKTEDSYWLLSIRSVSDRPEVLAFRSWLKEEFAACFGARGVRAA